MAKMYAIQDVKAKVFHAPFVQRTRGEAVRSFTTLSNDANTEISKFPTDFLLFELGDFDSDSGRIVPYADLQLVGCATDFKASPAVQGELLSQIRRDSAATGDADSVRRVRS